MPQSYTCLHYHLIFSTKHRAPLITPDLQPRTYDYLGGLVRAEDGVLLAAGGVADHVHLLARLGQSRPLADVMRVVKTNSSRWAHGLAPVADFAWQTGYAAFTVSRSHLGAVERSIRGQEEHHRRVSFQDELRAFLRRHEIEPDGRYLWD
jgi:REP element-mobilizing transposase RayT